MQQDEASSGDEEDENDIDDAIHNNNNSNETGNLVFGRRKIAFFYLVTAQDREKARSWVRHAIEACKKRDREILDIYLKNIQKKQRQHSTDNSKNDDDTQDSVQEEDFEFFLDSVNNNDATDAHTSSSATAHITSAL